MRTLAAALLLLALIFSRTAAQEPSQTILHFDFAKGLQNMADLPGEISLRNGPGRNQLGYLEFTNPQQFAELDESGVHHLSESLQDARSLTIGGWFYCRRSGEQSFVERGSVEIGSLGERLFRPDDSYINFHLGTDGRGFFAGTIHGNGSMPFVHVTINSVPIMTWQQLTVVKDERGFHNFYQNGKKVHGDEHSIWAPASQLWRETEAGLKVPMRLRMPMGGLIAETWIVGRALTADEIAQDFNAKRSRYAPSPEPQILAVREMNAESNDASRPFDRETVHQAVMKLLGPFPSERVALDPQTHEEIDCGEYIRRKISIQVQPGDRMPAFLLIPKRLAESSLDRDRARAAAIICFYGTTSGAGKLTTVGLSGRKTDDPPHANLSFAIDIAKAGFAALAPDYLRDGERIHPGDRPYDTRRFYEEFPNWSIHGKDIWDTMRAIDYLQTLDFVDGSRIGMMGHSYGGHSTIFAAAVEPRIKVAVANGPVSAFREHGMHWAVPAGASNSQSLPAMRPYLLNPESQLPVTFAEWTALIAPRALLVGQAVGERRPLEEQNYGEVRNVYQSLGASGSVQYMWYAGDHDFPPEARSKAVEWFKRWFEERQ